MGVPTFFFVLQDSLASCWGRSKGTLRTSYFYKKKCWSLLVLTSMCHKSSACTALSIDLNELMFLASLDLEHDLIPVFGKSLLWHAKHQRTRYHAKGFSCFEWRDLSSICRHAGACDFLLLHRRVLDQPFGLNVLGGEGRVVSHNQINFPCGFQKIMYCST